ncbi:6926_t:CDS:1, partial [Funneliformis caledonium]
NHEDNELFLSLISQSIPKTYSDTETIEGSEDNDEVYEKRKSILDNIYAKPNELSKIENELNNYLSLEEEGKNTDPFDWWKLTQLYFPILSTLVRKYLEICPTSVPFKRLFSNVGNNITAKRSNLKLELVGEMLFLERNMNLFDSIFPSEDR